MAGSMEFQFADSNGDTHALSDADIVNQLKSAGQDVQGVSADGMTLTIGQAAPGGKGKAQAVQVPTANALKALGYEVKGMQPVGADTDHVDDELSALVQSLPDDDMMKRSYVQAKLAHRGVQAPQIAGSGNDWHVFNPETNQWVQVTRDPGLNMAGLYSAGLALPHIIGAGLGGAAGVAAGAAASLPGGGLGAVPGAVIGGGLGSAAGKALTTGAISAFDPDYRAAIGGHLGEAALDTAKIAGMDGLGMGAGKLLGGAAPLSKALQAGGRTLDAAGSIADGAAGKLAGNRFATSALTNMTPGVRAVIGPAELAQAPGAAVRGLAGAAAGVDGQFGRAVLGDELAGRLGRGARAITQARPSGTGLRATVQDAAETAGDALGRTPPAPELSERDILGNLVSRSRAGRAYASSPDWALEEEQADKSARQLAAQYGLSPEEEQKIAQGARADTREGAVNQMMRQDMSEENWGSRLGSGLRNLRQAGQGVQSLAEGAVRGGLRTVQGLGKVAQGVGAGARAVGTVAQPLELPMAARYGIPKAYNWWEDQNQEP